MKFVVENLGEFDYSTRLILSDNRRLPMSHGLRFATCLVLAMSLMACQYLPKEQPTKAIAAPTEESSEIRTAWQQITWAAGGGYPVAHGGNGYAFSSGVQVKKDGSLTLNQLNGAVKT